MSRQELRPGRLWVQQGGRGEPALLLLHGLGASGEVWAGVRDLLDQRWPGRWVIPDLREHGRSGHAPPYSFGRYAADIATLSSAGERVLVLGHSIGGVVGLALASGNAWQCQGLATRGNPDDWPVVLLESRAARQELHRMPVTGCLAALAAGELATGILPADVVHRPSHQFAPFD